MRTRLAVRRLPPLTTATNDKNAEYASGEADYDWNGISDNCVHTVRNALAAANIWAPITVWAVRFDRLFNLAIPANEFVNLAQLGAEGPIEDYQLIQEDDALRDALHEYHWLPSRHGALLNTLPIHQPNDVLIPASVCLRWTHRS